MTINLPSIQPINTVQPDSLAPASDKSGAFQDALSSAIREVEGSRNDANQSVEKFLSGEGEDLHTTILASQRAELEFQMFMQVRNKVVNAYQEIMKMQL